MAFSTLIENDDDNTMLEANFANIHFPTFSTGQIGLVREGWKQVMKIFISQCFHNDKPGSKL